MKNKTKRLLPAIITILVACIASVVVIFLLEYTSLKDLIKNIGYEHPAEISALESRLNFTDSAKTIFKASRPILESRETFNHNCESYDAEISVLGCYTNDQIHLYNIVSDQLPGIIESTAAHELLHAVWRRLPSGQRDNLTSELIAVYEQNQDLLDEELSTYSDDVWLDELHARIGTQIAALPASLEQHYAKYFTDQDAIVTFYQQYREPFNQLQDQLDLLSTEIETLATQIESDTAKYYERANALSSQITQFNSCANTQGCFNSEATFYAQRRALINEQAYLEDLYASIDQAILLHNQKVDQYNNNLLRSESLENAINSNAPPDQSLLQQNN